MSLLNGFLDGNGTALSDGRRMPVRLWPSLFLRGLRRSHAASPRNVRPVETSWHLAGTKAAAWVGAVKVLALSIGAVAVLLSASAAGAQQADHSGTWVLDPTRSDSAIQSESTEPITLIITMGPSDVSIERREGAGSLTFSYRANGSPTISTVGSERTVGTLRWDGPKLVTETVYLGANPLAQIEVRTVSSDGREMVIETTLLLVEGYEDSGTGVTTGVQAASGKDTYIRR